MSGSSEASIEKKVPNSTSIGDVESQNSEKIEGIEQADNTLDFINGYEKKFDAIPGTEAEESKIFKKINWNLLPLLIAFNTVMFMEKATLSYSVLLGLYKSTGINDTKYDNTNSLFYTGYTIGQLLNFVMQKYSIKKFLTSITFCWAAIVFLQAAAYNYGGLMVLRLFLGFIEAVMVPLMEITMLQFYTPNQRASLSLVFWTGCVGFPVIIPGFIAYGILHVTDSIPPWKIFMIINGGIALIMSVVAWFWYPSDPTEAHFLNEREKYVLIKRIQRTSKAAITQHTIKKYQLVETLKDPITWLFALMCFLIMLANNLTYQQSILYLSLGVSNLDSTLVSVAGGGFSMLFALATGLFIHYVPDSTFWVCLIGCVPSIAGGIAMITIPWSNKIGLLAALLLASNTYFTCYIAGFTWSSSSCSGNTKRYFRHFIYCVAYGISNIISPQLWTGDQGTRYYPAWIVQIVLAWTFAPAVAGVITIILKKRNRERRQYIAEHPEALYGTIVKTDPETGEKVTEKVDIGTLDLTDLENKAFIYPL